MIDTECAICEAEFPDRIKQGKVTTNGATKFEKNK